MLNMKEWFQVNAFLSLLLHGACDRQDSFTHCQKAIQKHIPSNISRDRNGRRKKTPENGSPGAAEVPPPPPISWVGSRGKVPGEGQGAKTNFSQSKRVFSFVACQNPTMKLGKPIFTCHTLTCKPPRNVRMHAALGHFQTVPLRAN